MDTAPIQSGIIIHCRRRKAIATRRKFLAACGSKVTFNLDHHGCIVNTESDNAHCKPGCEHCKKKIQESCKIVLTTH